MKPNNEEKVEVKTRLNKAVAEAKEEGRKAGAEEATATAVRFLALANSHSAVVGWGESRVTPIGALSSLIHHCRYETAVDACLKLVNGSEDKINGYNLTCMTCL